jgi:histidinol dehydrogenase
MPRVRRFALTEEGSDQAERLAEVAAEMRAAVPSPPEVEREVAEIVTKVRDGGDRAVVELTRRFDSETAPGRLRVDPGRVARALGQVDRDVKEALEQAMTNVRDASLAELSEGAATELPEGQRIAITEMPVRRAGVYAPGGRAAYPSTIVMCCVPAKAAGVEEVAVATPPGANGEPNEAVLAACAICGVHEIYSMGGAQAIAALAYGTESVAPVDVIAGPGNHYVQEAKRQAVGRVGIDGIAGPTELVVVAGGGADPGVVALDLAAQGEHGDDALLVLLADSESLLDSVEREYAEIERANETVAAAPLALAHVPSLEAAIALANAIAPEHLEIVAPDAERLTESVRSSGCVFISGGAAFGDYVAGSNHVLPTGGAARYGGPLGVATFRRRQALVSLPGRAARALAPHVSSLARAEGFPVHASSAEAWARAGERS